MEILNTMKKKFTITLVFVSMALISYAQTDTWDIPATEQMIGHNKQNYSDHNDAKNNQVISQATVSNWKNSTNQFKSLSDYIDKRLTSAFIVIADVTTLYNIYNQLAEMMDYEQKSFAIVKRHPWAVPLMVSEQTRIIKSGNDLFNYISLLVLSYGDISKMKVSARKVIFHSIDLQVGVLKARCYSMYNMMKRLDLTSEIRNSKPGQMINKDKQIIRDILKNFK
jgi:hypothetical protein